MQSRSRPRSAAQRGFAYVEVLLSVTLLAVLLVPALQALQSGIAGNAANLSARPLALQAKMEEVLAQPFGDLYAETYLVGGNTTASVSSKFSDPGGVANRRLVVLYRYNSQAKVKTPSDSGLLYVSVYFEADGSASALATLIGRWW